jgi:hypothetical protein
MYQSFISLEEARRHPLRIHDPWSYRVAYEEQFVPITIEEAFLLAPHFPVVWKRDEAGRLQLIIVRGLARAESSLPGVRRNIGDALPLLLQAYPFRHRNERAGQMELGLDRVSPMQTKDIGAPIFAQNGEFTPGAELKRLALDRYAGAISITNEICELFAELGILQPVSFPKALVERLNLPELMHLGGLGDDRVLLDSLLQQFGNVVASFIFGHKLSLYRMGPLVALANAAAKDLQT